MKIKYQFATEETEIEVDEQWATILVDLDRKEYNNDHKETRRHYSLEARQYEGSDYSLYDEGLMELLGRNFQEDKLHDAIEQLTPAQQELVHKIFFEGYSINEYAAMCGVGKSAISRRISRIKNYLKKFINDVNF